MSAPQHTAGPWILPFHPLSVEKRSGELRSIICKLHPLWLCEEHGGDVEANARLIAAAPELLAALSALMGYIDNGTLVRNIERDGEPDFTIRMMSFVRDLGAAQSAIAKAKGEGAQ